MISYQIAYKIVLPTETEGDKKRQVIGTSPTIEILNPLIAMTYRMGLNVFSTPVFLFRDGYFDEILKFHAGYPGSEIYRCSVELKDELEIYYALSLSELLYRTPEDMNDVWDYIVETNRTYRIMISREILLSLELGRSVLVTKRMTILKKIDRSLIEESLHATL